MITDDTLREGLQAPGMSLTIEEKLEIADLLSKAGLKSAMVAYPSAHSTEIEVTREIVKRKFFNETFALGRTLEQDIDVIDSTGADISLHLPFKFEDTSEIIKAVKYASKKGKKLEVAVVDVIKYNEEMLFKLCSEIVGAGTDILQLPDTTGMANPAKFERIISTIRSKFKDVEIEIHCHNDCGLSMTNAILGLRAGADRVDTTVYGLGERNGITDQMGLATYLQNSGVDTGIDLKKLSQVYDRVLDLILKKMGPGFFSRNYPIVGGNVGVHTAGTHAAFSDVFHAEEFSVNVYTGKSMVRKILENSGIQTTPEQLSKIVLKIKDQAVETGMALKTDDIRKIAGEIVG